MAISKHAESIHDRYSSRELSGEVWHFLRHEGNQCVKSLEEENEETDWRYHFVAKWQLIKKLEGLLQNQVTAYKTGFLLITRSLINAALN